MDDAALRDLGTDGVVGLEFPEVVPETDAPAQEDWGDCDVELVNESGFEEVANYRWATTCLLYTSPSPRD